MHVKKKIITAVTNSQSSYNLVSKKLDKVENSSRSIYLNSNMTPRLSCHFSIFGLVYLFVLKSLLGIARQWSREKFAMLSLKPRSHVIFLIYRTWAITNQKTNFVGCDNSWSVFYSVLMSKLFFNNLTLQFLHAGMQIFQ